MSALLFLSFLASDTTLGHKTVDSQQAPAVACVAPQAKTDAQQSAREHTLLFRKCRVAEAKAVMSGRISRFHEARVAVFQALSVSLRKPIRDPSWNIARAKLLRLHEAVVALRQPLVDLDRLPPEILLDRGYSSHDIAEVDNEERSISRLNLSVSAQFDDIVRQFVAVEAEMMKTGDLMPDKYRGRDGAAEAKANFLAGGGPILYYSDYNGRAPGITVHGLNCWTSYDPFGSIKFVMLPEASFYERGFFDIVADVRSASASRFAQAYNRFVFKTREADVLRACPKASVIMSAGDREADAAK